MTQYIDIAVNLLSERLKHDIDAIINDAAKHHVSPLIVIGSDIDESKQASLLCEQFPQQLYCTAGVHPHQASSWNEQSSNTVKQLASQHNVVAIGECGLDYNRDFSPRPAQRQAFAAQLELACELNMPVLMHCRDAHQDFIAIVNEYRSELPKALLHCFTGTKNELESCLAADLYIGITGWICDERRGQELAQLVPLIPNNRIMAETDSPYLLPRSMRPKPKSSKNLPQYLPYIVNTMAQLRQQSETELAQYCFQNSCDFFGLTINQVMVDK
ncbi:TatD family hydrolase [Shewanella inventionis]|uniref:DNase TatD n=1 Tax=Shewanella inventionis TaxID=1738770 RepID=A0ABQ1JKF4_9GAMM|nr:TatD family hydrolase [Shewanella inventionis]MCL1159088.1 TatD family hydrolase [Shewanella inventionis]UAL43220.1 TatD family hydrolase [Shewanella inventionis]GGB71246.1 DNase TatD [Shewanella inventionis]